MALVLADRVKETTTTTGTGTVTLLGASSGFQSFATIGNGNTTFYCISAQTGTEWEVGIGTYTSAGTTLARTTVLSSSNGGSLVNFSAGTKDVFVTLPSQKSAVVVSVSAPTSPTNGQLWWDATYGRLMIYYSDADGSQWVTASIQGPAGPTGPTGPAGPAVSFGKIIAAAIVFGA